jgi:phage-related minor tail protein
MKFKTGAVVGFAVGYYLGAKAGRERYEQLRKMLDKAGPQVTKMRAAVELGVERLRDLTESEVEHEGLEPMLRPSSN